MGLLKSGKSTLRQQPPRRRLVSHRPQPSHRVAVTCIRNGTRPQAHPLESDRKSEELEETHVRQRLYEELAKRSQRLNWTRSTEATDRLVPVIELDLTVLFMKISCLGSVGHAGLD